MWKGGRLEADGNIPSLHSTAVTEPAPEHVRIFLQNIKLAVGAEVWVISVCDHGFPNHIIVKSDFMTH